MNLSKTPAQKNPATEDLNPKNPKKQRMDDGDSTALQKQALGGLLRLALVSDSETYAGVLDYLNSYKEIEIPPSEEQKKLIVRFLEGMTIRNKYERHRKFTFHGLSESHVDNLPKLDLGMTANRRLIEVPMQDGIVFIKDNPTNGRLRRLLSPENVENKDGCLENKWQLVFLGQNPPTSTLEEFGEKMADKWGKPSSDKIIYISNEAELKNQLSNVVSGTEILLCVMQKVSNNSFYKALKREAELEKEISTKCCNVQSVENYCSQKEMGLVYSLGLEMIAKTGGYKGKAFLRYGSFPLRFGDKCKVMYLGYSMFNFDPQATVMIGNIGEEHSSASDYVSVVAQNGRTSENDTAYVHFLPSILDQLLRKYKDNNLGRFPDRIIFFRQGCVIGPMEDTLRKEVDALEKMKDQKVPITFVVSYKNIGTHSVILSDGSASYRYSIFSDENALCYKDFETLIKNLSYSWRYPKPLPAHYTKCAADLAKICLGGKENPGADKVSKAIDRSLCVIGAQQKDGAADQQQSQQMEVEK
ncbi:hypothetical protein SUGI_0814090 [Cryptomeria japonica]|nr:hypothetical protein SUGI_0814090 [Cryptomeria japonica]